MKWLASALLLGVFIRHDTSYWLAAHSPWSAREWFYVLGGAWEAALCAVLLMFFYAMNVRWRFMAIAAMWIGILESAQMVTCTLTTKTLATLPAGMNTCDYLTGLPVGATMMALYLILICYGVAKSWRA